MASKEVLPNSLQEAVLAVLAFDQKHGALISAQVQPEHFDGAYNDVATAVLAYRKRYNKAPGRAHLENLFSRAKVAPSDPKTHALRRMLFNLATQAEGINAEYVASRTQDFVRAQNLKSALLAANERYMQGGDELVDEVEQILYGALKSKQTTLDAGTFLNDTTKAFAFLNRLEDFCSLGIPELDRLEIGLIPKQLLLYIAPKSTGKSWFSVHAGRQGLLQKQKVLHVSLEMDETLVVPRYYQSFFGIAKRPDSFTKAEFNLDDLNRLTGFKVGRLTPKFSFSDPDIRKILRAKVQHWGARFGRLVVKAFPSGSLTVPQLVGYLDYLELTHNFIPNVLIVDYLDLMRQDIGNLRASLTKTVVDLRGLADKRNLAVVAPTQSNRSGIGAKKVSSTNVSEDIGKVFTADTVLSYSQTEEERKFGLARLTVEHARNAETGACVLLAQSYATGQYVLESAALNNTYWERLETVSGKDVSFDADDT